MTGNSTCQLTAKILRVEKLLMGSHKEAFQAHFYLSYTIYINDMPEIDKLAKFILYADDANIIITGKNTLKIEQKMIELNKGQLDG